MLQACFVNTVAPAREQSLKSPYDARAIRRKSSTPSSSPRAVGATPARSRISDAAAAVPPSTPETACRSILRRCWKAASTIWKVRSRSASVPRSSASRVNATRTLSTLDRPEHLPRDGPGEAPRSVPGRLHTRRAVDLRSGRGCEPFADLGLHHDHTALQVWEGLEEVQQHRNRDVVGKVRNQHRGFAGQLRHAQRIGVDDLERTGCDAVRSRGLGKAGGQAVVDLHGRHRRAGLEDGEGQRPQSGPDLDDALTGLHPCDLDDPAHRIRVDDEILPELLRGRDVQFGGQRADFGRAEEGHGHEFTVAVRVCSLSLTGSRRARQGKPRRATLLVEGSNEEDRP